MRTGHWALAIFATTAQAASLIDVCTTFYAKSVLPENSDFVTEGIDIDPSSLTVSLVNNATADSLYYPEATIDYCNVTFAYSHSGLDDKVHVQYWMPAPGIFKNRYLATGGFGYAINVESTFLPGGIVYGAVSGATDGGFGSFSDNFDAVYPLVNGTKNNNALYMFAYQGIHEQTIIGKQFARNFFNMSSEENLYSYYQGCSEGGREGWSQIQRFADQWDGAITGCPAMRFAHQQINHVFGALAEKEVGYAPPYCELEAIANLTIAACDSYDGKTDGVIGRSDLCKLRFNLDTLVGEPYSCAASGSSSQVLKKRQIMNTAPTPAQNGTITQKGVEIAKKYYDGLFDSEGKRVYLSYQPGTSFDDAETTYNETTDSWSITPSSFGTEFISRFLKLEDTDSITDWDNVTADTLKEWIHTGWQLYEDSLQTTWPELTPFHKAGGKIIHFHGESDNSVPTAASVHYWESVRKVMYPKKSYKEGAAALNDWYRLYLIPGAAHCNTNSLQPNGPYPRTTLTDLIRWVEDGVTPITLSATIQGEADGESQPLCAYPERPLWINNGTDLICVYPDQESINVWQYEFDAFNMPVY